jgi:hypothetical protein
MTLDGQRFTHVLGSRAPLTDDRPILEYRTRRGLEEKQFVRSDS